MASNMNASREPAKEGMGGGMLPGPEGYFGDRRHPPAQWHPDALGLTEHTQICPLGDLTAGQDGPSNAASIQGESTSPWAHWRPRWNLDQRMGGMSAERAGGACCHGSSIWSPAQPSLGQANQTKGHDGPGWLIGRWQPSMSCLCGETAMACPNPRKSLALSTALCRCILRNDGEGDHDVDSRASYAHLGHGYYSPLRTACFTRWRYRGAARKVLSNLALLRGALRPRCSQACSLPRSRFRSVAVTAN